MKERKIAWVFPGQGIQKVGMGSELFNRYLLARGRYSTVDRISNKQISKISFEGSEEEQNRTDNTQLLVFTHNQICYELLKDRKAHRFPVAYVAGSSLGEYNALVAAGACDFEDTIRLVQERSKLMHQAQEINPGGLVATRNPSEETIEIFNKMGIQIALINTHEQTVFGGSNASLDTAEIWAKQNQVRLTRLKVGGAFHTSLMEPAVEPFSKALERVEIRDSEIPIIANTTAKPIRKAEDIREELIKQLTSTVLFRDTISFLDQQGLYKIIEASPEMIVINMVQKMIAGGTVGFVIIAGGIKAGSWWRRGHSKKSK